MRCECRGCEHTVVVYGRIGAGSRSDLGKVRLSDSFTVKIEDALRMDNNILTACYVDRPNMKMNNLD